ncbi:MAG: HAD-IA family hydrolase [Nocardioides sp.]
MSKPTAVVFDLGNVLIRWDPRPALAAAVGADEADRFLAADDFDFGRWNAAQDAGRPFDEAEDQVAASHPHWAEHVRGYRPHFAHSLTGPVDDTVGILSDLHAAGVPVYALTNWSAETFPHATDRYGFLDLFEDVVVSGQVGVAKPDQAIFEVLRERVGRPLDECVFVDDSAANVAAADRAGMDAIRFTDTGHLRADLRARGLPV